MLFLNCKANARVKPAKTGHGPHSSKIIFVLFCVLFYFCVVLCIVCFVSFCVLSVCKCVLYYCHRVATQLQSTYVSYHIHQWCQQCIRGLVDGESPVDKGYIPDELNLHELRCEHHKSRICLPPYACSWPNKRQVFSGPGSGNSWRSELGLSRVPTETCRNALPPVNTPSVRPRVTTI